MPTLAGFLLSFAFPVVSSVRTIELLVVIMLLFLLTAIVTHQGGFSFIPKATHAVTQLMLEELWANFRAELILKGLWDEDQHIRFVIYIPMRWMSIGRSHLIPSHYLDSDPERNSANFSIVVRTANGWAGRTLVDGKPYVADLDQTQSLLDLGLTEREMKRVVEELGIRSKICIPLMADGTAVGVLGLESQHPMSRTKFNQDPVLQEVLALRKPCLKICRTAYWLKEHQVPGPGVGGVHI